MQVRNQDRRDQVAADDKEDVDTDKTAAEHLKTRVGQYDGQHRDSPQPVDFRPVPQFYDGWLVAHHSMDRFNPEFT